MKQFLKITTTVILIIATIAGIILLINIDTRKPSKSNKQ